MSEKKSMKEIREHYRKEKRDEFYNDVMTSLKYAIDLKELGKNSEGNEAVNAIIDKLNNSIESIEAELNNQKTREFDRIILPDKGEPFADGDKTKLTVISESDKDNSELPVRFLTQGWSI